MKETDPAPVAILINREHSRLSSQVKMIERVLHTQFSDKEHQRLKRRGLVTADGIVPMGVREAPALIEREEAQTAQSPKRGVVAWVADGFRRW